MRQAQPPRDPPDSGPSAACRAKQGAPDGETMRDDLSHLDRPRAHGGAGAAPRPDAPPGRAGPGGNGAALRGGLDRARDCPAPGLLRRYRAHDAQAVHPARPADAPPPAARPPKDWARAEHVMAALHRRVDEPRTWTAKQVAHALQEEGLRLSPRHTRNSLNRRG